MMRGGGAKLPYIPKSMAISNLILNGVQLAVMPIITTSLAIDFQIANSCQLFYKGLIEFFVGFV